MVQLRVYMIGLSLFSLIIAPTFGFRAGLLVNGYGPSGQGSSYYWRAAQLVDFLLRNSQNSSVQEQYKLSPDEIALLQVPGSNGVNQSEPFRIELFDNQFRADLTTGQVLNAVNFCNTSTELAVDTILGPPFSALATETSKIAALFQIPVLSQGAPSAVLDDRVLYPTFSRNYPSDLFSPVLISNLLLRFEWKRVALLYSDGVEGSAFSQRFISVCQKRGIDIIIAQSISFGLTSNTDTVRRAELVTAALKLIKASGARIIILNLGVVDMIFEEVIAKPAAALGMMGSDPAASQYVWIGTESICITATRPLGSLATGLMCPMPFVSTTSAGYKLFVDRFTLFIKQQFNETLPVGWSALTYVNHYDTAFFLAKAITRFSIAVRTVTGRVGLPFSMQEKSAFLPWLRNTTWAGATGFLQMDVNGNRVMTYMLMNRIPDAVVASDPKQKPELYDLKLIAFLSSSTDMEKYVAPNLLQQPRFADGSTTVPPDRILYTRFTQGQKLTGDWTVRKERMVLAFFVSVVGAWISLAMMDTAVETQLALQSVKSRTHAGTSVKLSGKSRERVFWLMGVGLAQGVSCVSCLYAAASSLDLSSLATGLQVTWYSVCLLLAFPLACAAVYAQSRTIRITNRSEDEEMLRSTRLQQVQQIGTKKNKNAFQDDDDDDDEEEEEEESTATSNKTIERSKSKSLSNSKSVSISAASSSQFGVSTKEAFRRYIANKRQSKFWWRASGAWFAILHLMISWVQGLCVCLFCLHGIVIDQVTTAPSSQTIRLDVSVNAWLCWILGVLPFEIISFLLFSQHVSSPLRSITTSVSQGLIWFFWCLGFVFMVQENFVYATTLVTENVPVAQATTSDLFPTNDVITHSTAYLVAIGLIGISGFLMMAFSMSRLRGSNEYVKSIVLRGKKELRECEQQLAESLELNNNLHQTIDMINVLCMLDAEKNNQNHNQSHPAWLLLHKHGSHVKIATERKEPVVQTMDMQNELTIFEKVINEPLGIEIMKIVCNNRHTNESIHFIAEMQLIRKLAHRNLETKDAKETQTIQQYIQHIVELYIKDSAFKQVNISDNMRSDILRNLTGEIKLSTFDRAYEEIKKLLLQNDWPQFRKHPLGRQYLTQFVT